MYGSSKQGWMGPDWKKPATDFTPLLDSILENVPEPKIAEGTLIRPIPRNKMIDVKILPAVEIGVTSPYPTSNNYDSQYWRIAVGPQDIANIDASLMTGSTPSTVLNGAKSYTIMLLNSTNVQESEAVTFNLDQQCSKYEPVRLHWLNRLGGIDSFNFNLKSTNKSK